MANGRALLIYLCRGENIRLLGDSKFTQNVNAESLKI
jgi:hypothetical protein